MKNLEEIINFLKKEIQEITLDKHDSHHLDDDALFLENLSLDSLDYAQLVINAESFIGNRLDENNIDWRDLNSIKTMAKALYDCQIK